MSTRHFALAVILLAAPAAGNLSAQQGRGTISGTVTDAQGAVVPGAQVLIRNLATNVAFRTSANEAGFYAAPSLAVGEYQVSAEIAGFKKSVRSGIHLEVDQRAMVNLVLEVGQVSESIEVVGEAPLVDTGSATVGKVVENRRIQELPLNGRNALALAMLTPGVRTSVGSTYSGFIDRGVRISTMSINNSPGGMNDQLLDGNHNVLTWINEVAVPPAVDAVEEFKVQSGVMSAEFGYTAGGVVNLVSKSGANAFRGTAYEFLRHDKLDARNTFAATRERLRYNQFGGSLGGPVKRDRTFFFGNYEEYRVRQGSPRIATVPIAAERKGDYSDTRTVTGVLIPIHDPQTTRGAGGALTRDLFPGNVIPSSRLDPVAQRSLELIPLPNRTPSNAFTHSQNYQTEIVPTTDSRQYHLRVDHKLSSSNSLFARYSWFAHKPFQKQVIFPGDIFGRIDDMANKNIALSDTHIFSPTVINELRIGVVRQAFTFMDASYGQGWPRKLGFPANVPNDVIPTLSISGYTSIGYGLYGKRGSMNWNFQDILSRIRGNHTMKFGFEHRLIEGNNRQTSSPSGAFTFTAALTGNPARPSGTGSSVASTVLGAVRSAVLDQSQGISMRAYASALFFQDDWKVTRRLTLNLGLRYDFQQQPVERHNRLMQFDMTGKSSVSGLTGRAVYASVNGQPRQWRDEDYSSFGPRAGFAWDLFGKGRTVLRGGYGVYYPLTFYSGGNFGSQGLGFSTMRTTYVPPGSDYNYVAFQLKDGFPYAPLQPLGASGGDDAFLGQTVPYTETDGASPRAQQWNLSLQQQLPGRWLVDLTYSANKGTHFVGANYDWNELEPQQYSLGRALQTRVPNPYAGKVPGSLGDPTITRLQSLLPYPYYVDVTITNPHSGNYFSNLLLLSVQKRTTRGLTLMFSYTAGKAISDPLRLPQADFGDNQARMKTYQNGKFDRRSDRSVDPQDVSQRAVVSGLYELPFGPGKPWNPSSALVRKLSEGWQLTAITTLQTGLPIGITGANNFLAGRPNSTGQSARLQNPTDARWFDTAAFVNPPEYTFGNVGRTLPDVRAPGTVNWDISLLKSVHLTERVNLQFRAEAFNVFNHVNLGLPGSGFVAGPDGKNSSGSFGVISSARDARQVQFGLKLRF